MAWRSCAWKEKINKIIAKTKFKKIIKLAKLKYVVKLTYKRKFEMLSALSDS